MKKFAFGCLTLALITALAIGALVYFWPRLEPRAADALITRLLEDSPAELSYAEITRGDPSSLALRGVQLSYSSYALSCESIEVAAPYGLRSLSIAQERRIEWIKARDCEASISQQHIGTLSETGGTDDGSPLWAQLLDRVQTKIGSVEVDQLRVDLDPISPGLAATLTDIVVTPFAWERARAELHISHRQLPDGLTAELSVDTAPHLRWRPFSVDHPDLDLAVNTGELKLDSLDAASLYGINIIARRGDLWALLNMSDISLRRQARQVEVRDWTLHILRTPTLTLFKAQRPQREITDGRVRARQHELSSVGLPGSEEARALHESLETMAHDLLTRLGGTSRSLPDSIEVPSPQVNLDLRRGRLRLLSRWSLAVPSAQLSEDGELQIDLRSQGITLTALTNLNRLNDITLSLDDLRWQRAWGDRAIDTTLRLDGILQIQRGSVRAEANLRVQNTTLTLPAVAEQPITPVEARGLAAMELDLSELGSEAFALSIVGTLNRAPVRFTAMAERQDGLLNINVGGGLSQEHPCNDTLLAIPEPLLPTIGHRGLRLSGEFMPSLNFSITLGNADTAEVTAEGFPGECEIRSIHRELDPERLNSPDYVHHVQVGTDLDDLYVGPGTDSFVPIIILPSYVPAAMYLSEEIAFFRNHGISMSLLNRALRMNIDYGRYIYGGSTVTQQLVKNLFLTRTKTLSRKLEELILTWALELHVSKERILELYLNCIEFGPNIYGIGAAAQHYFGRDAWELTPLEATYLAALKPSPRVGDTFLRRGHTPLTGYFPERLRELLGRLHRFGGHIHEDEIDHYSPWVVRFDEDSPQDSAGGHEFAAELGLSPDKPHGARRRANIPRPPNALVRLFDAEREGAFRPGPVIRAQRTP